MTASGKRVVATTVAATLLLLGHTAVDAYCPALAPRVCSTFFRSDAVFIATVLFETRVIAGDDFIDEWRYRVRVKRVYRGEASGIVEVFTENDSARRTLRKGRDYLLFANMADGRLRIASDCGPASDDSRMAANIRDIEALSRQTTGTIEGEVRTAASGSGVAGIPIVISGIGQTQRTTSGANGAFRVALPPGRYRVTVDPAVAVPYDLNWIDDSNITLQAGECAQLLYIASRR